MFEELYYRAREQMAEMQVRSQKQEAAHAAHVELLTRQARSKGKQLEVAFHAALAKARGEQRRLANEDVASTVQEKLKEFELLQSTVQSTREAAAHVLQHLDRVEQELARERMERGIATERCAMLEKRIVKLKARRPTSADSPPPGPEGPARIRPGTDKASSRLEEVQRQRRKLAAFASPPPPVQFKHPGRASSVVAHGVSVREVPLHALGLPSKPGSAREATPAAQRQARVRAQGTSRPVDANKVPKGIFAARDRGGKGRPASARTHALRTTTRAPRRASSRPASAKSRPRTAGAFSTIVDHATGAPASRREAAKLILRQSRVRPASAC